MKGSVASHITNLRSVSAIAYRKWKLLDPLKTEQTGRIMSLGEQVSKLVPQVAPPWPIGKQGHVAIFDRAVAKAGDHWTIYDTESELPENLRNRGVNISVAMLYTDLRGWACREN